MAVIESDKEITWEQDYRDRINPELVTNLAHQAVPVLKWTGWSIQKVGPGYCETRLPLCLETTNQHGTHQAALISLSADYTGGMALATLLTGTPLTGIHRGKPEESASLWLVGMEVRYELPSTSHLRGQCKVDPKTARRIQSRYFAGKVVLVSLEVQFWSEDGQRVAMANMKYLAQATQKLLEKREDGERSALSKLNLKTSARIIAGLRSMEMQTSSSRLAADANAWHRIDHAHDMLAAGTHGLLQARRLNKVLPQLGRLVNARTAHCDRFLEDFDGVEQIVLLGAGLDMRPARMAQRLRGVTVFEMDLPVMLSERASVIEKLTDQRSPRAVKFPERHPIAADFLHDDPGSLLRGHRAFSETAVTAVIYEGCSMYFDEAQNIATLSSVLRRIKNRESRLWMDCVSPEVVNGRTPDKNVHEFINQMELIGEKFIYGPADPKAFLRASGWILEQQITAGEYVNDKDPTLGEYRFVVGRRNAVDL